MRKAAKAGTAQNNMFFVKAKAILKNVGDKEKNVGDNLKNVGDFLKISHVSCGAS